MVHKRSKLWNFRVVHRRVGAYLRQAITFRRRSLNLTRACARTHFDAWFASFHVTRINSSLLDWFNLFWKLWFLEQSIGVTWKNCSFEVSFYSSFNFTLNSFCRYWKSAKCNVVSPQQIVCSVKQLTRISYNQVTFWKVKALCDRFNQSYIDTNLSTNKTCLTGLTNLCNLFLISLRISLFFIAKSIFLDVSYYLNWKKRTTFDFSQISKKFWTSSISKIYSLEGVGV